MPVYLFTFHAYRSWGPDKARGYVRRGEGMLAPDPEMARWYDKAARHDRMRFDRTIQCVLVDSSREICAENGIRLHQVATDPTHLHALVSWRHEVTWIEFRNTLKRRLGAEVSKALNRKGPWFSRGASRKHIRDREHFEYLMNKYLPDHRGLRWSEREDRT